MTSKSLCLVALLAAGLPVWTLPVQAQESSQSEIARRAVTVAQNYLDTLDRAQLGKAWLPFQSSAVPAIAEYTRSGGPQGGGRSMANFTGERYGQAVWSNYPASDVLRPGLPLGEMTEDQRAAAMTLLQSVLSPEGFEKVRQIMGADQALHEAGTNYASGTDAYTLGIFGTPSDSGDWMIQFGAHHLGLNLVIRSGAGTITPTMTGAQPAIYTNDAGETVRALAAENDLAFALLDSFSEDQRDAAVLDYEVGDLVYGPGKTGDPVLPEGLQGSAMSDDQKAMLMDIVRLWAGIVTEEWAAPRLDQIEAELDETWFAWSGPLTHEPERNGTSYYRIQGPHLIVEFSPQAVGGDKTMHVHTVYRDPTNAYGLGSME
ncbi:hypothetical protein LA6_005801 (plasmid) [Marinibacterium anthonyi]|nr:hypothetical protein LA6_005801 [Marinibacterium anthonyi]